MFSRPSLLGGRKTRTSPDDHPYSDVPMLVVGGVGRSGTTVLRNCVAAHRSIDCVNRESNYIFSLMRGASLYMDDDFKRLNLVVSEPEFWRLHQQFLLNLLWPSGRIRPQRIPPALATYSSMDPRAAIALDRSFDTLSILYIIRNGIEVVSSYRSFPNFSHLPFEQVCRIWSSQHSMLQYASEHGHVTVVRHEWLQKNRQQFTGALTAALKPLDLELDKACLKPLARQYHPTRVDGETRSEAGDRDQRKDRWRFWSDQQREFFADTCGDLMEQLGYRLPWT